MKKLSSILGAGFLITSILLPGNTLGMFRMGAKRFAGMATFGLLATTVTAKTSFSEKGMSQKDVEEWAIAMMEQAKPMLIMRNELLEKEKKNLAEAIIKFAQMNVQDQLKKEKPTEENLRDKVEDMLHENWSLSRCYTRKQPYPELRLSNNIAVTHYPTCSNSNKFTQKIRAASPNTTENLAEAIYTEIDHSIVNHYLFYKDHKISTKFNEYESHLKDIATIALLNLEREKLEREKNN